MNTIVRSIASLLLILFSVTLLLTIGKQALSSENNHDLNYALRTATQDATTNIMDENHLFGRDLESQFFGTDIEAATERFRSSLKRNTLSSRITEVDVSFSGITDGWAIYGLYSNGTVTVPCGYIFYKELDTLKIGDRTNADILYEFSLSDAFRETDLSTNTTTVKSLEELPEYYFSTQVKNDSFRNIAVMSSINEFLTGFYSNTENVTVINAGTGIEFNLGLFDYADNDSTVLNNLSAMIDGPGFFAVVDYYDTYLDRLVRVLSISGAELVASR